MCGIAGIITDNDRSSELMSMLESLAHRGPDQCSFTRVGSSFIGHTRLKIRGSDDITQPFIGADKNYYSVNGEFYNDRHWERTDSELASTINESELIGEFAFARMAPTGKEVELAVDRFGVKPLFYYWNPLDPEIVFASEPQSILILKYESVDDHDNVRQFVNMPVPGKTRWNNIYQVKPGHKVVLRVGKEPVEIQYWDIPIDLPYRDVSNKEIRERVVDSVSRRMNEGNVLFYVSNGMDGQIIYDTARSLFPDVKSLTCDLGDGDNYKAADISVKTLPDRMVDCVRSSVRTIYNPIGIAKFEMARTARELGYKVVMGGQGADELFVGYQFLYGEKWSGLSGDRKITHEAFQDIYGFTPQMFHPWIQLWNSSVFSEGDYDPFVEVAEMFSHLSYLDPITLNQYLWLKTHFVSQLMTWGGDRPEMANSVEGRLPFLDLVDLAFSIVPEKRINKQILRETYNKSLPKKSFMSPYIRTEYCCELLKGSIVGDLADVACWQHTTFKQLCSIYGQ